MPYRDERMACPRCGIELVAYPQRDKWRCKSCVGMLLGPAELEADLVAVEWPTRTSASARSTHAPVGCPACGERMQQVELFGIELERCTRDQLVWFDGGELGYVRAYLDASRDAESPLGKRLLAVLDDSSSDG
jgi:Zn-finger nucleic acid-binding protein